MINVHDKEINIGTYMRWYTRWYKEWW